MSISTYSYDDPMFPRSFDGEPRLATINSIKVLKKKLDLLYKSKLKKQPGELFLRKTDETTTLPEYGAVKGVIDRIMGEIPGFLSCLEENLGVDDVVRISFEPGCTGMQKMVSYIPLGRFPHCCLTGPTFVFADERLVAKNLLWSGRPRAVAFQTPERCRVRHDPR